MKRNVLFFTLFLLTFSLSSVPTYSNNPVFGENTCHDINDLDKASGDLSDSFTCEIESTVTGSVGFFDVNFTCTGSGTVSCDAGVDPMVCARKACDIAYAISEVCIERAIRNLFN